MRQTTIFTTALCALLCVGCDSNSAKNKQAASEGVSVSETEEKVLPKETRDVPEVATDADATDEPASEESNAQDDEQEPEAASDTPDSDTDLGLASDTPEDLETVESPAEEAQFEQLPPATRLLLPTSAGPVLVDVETHVDDALIQDAFAARIKKVMDDAKGDESELSWDSLYDHVSMNQEEFGRSMGQINRNQRRQMTQRYDKNRDTKPNADEVARFLFRSNGVDRPLRLVGTNYYRDMNRTDSGVFAALDTNGDHELSEEELEGAENALFRLDPNSDQRIDLAELTPAVQSTAMMRNDPAWNRRRTGRRGEVAMDLDGYVDWTMVSYALDDWLGQPHQWLTNNFVGQIDANEDGLIGKDEAKQSIECKPDLRLKLSFGNGGSASVQTLHTNLERASVTELADRVIVSTDKFTLMAIVNDKSQQRDGQRIQPELFAQLDANKDGFLEESEIPDGIPDEFDFDELDTDDNEKLSMEEINSRPQDVELPIWSVQVRGRGAEIPDAVFSWLDADHDQRLSSREISGAADRLRMCKVDGQPLKPLEIPDTFVLHFLRGDPQLDTQNFRMPAVPPRQGDAMPDWAVHMDSNRDGELSATEFLGSPAVFEKLDVNQDRFIDLQELNVLNAKN